MPFRVFFHPLADKEFSTAYQWYEARLEGLGNRFAKAIEERLNQIISTPLFYPKKKRNFREAKADTFPYLIVYKVYDEDKVIFISAIYHTSKDPRKKYRK